jgi:hypothetical protein
MPCSSMPSTPPLEPAPACDSIVQIADEVWIAQRTATVGGSSEQQDYARASGGVAGALFAGRAEGRRVAAAIPMNTRAAPTR